MPFIPQPGVTATGNTSSQQGAFKRNLVEDLNQGLKNPWHYIDAGDIGDGTTDARAAILAADADGPVDLSVAGTYLINSNMTLTRMPSISQGAKLKPASGIVVTLSAGYYAGNYHVFDISAGGSFAFAANSVSVAYPIHFGALSANADNTTYLQACIDSLAYLGVPVDIGPDKLLTGKLDITAFAKFTLYGTGTLKAKATRFLGAMLDFDASTDIDISGVTFDCNGAAHAAYLTGDYADLYCMAIQLDNASSRASIKNCKFYGLYNHYIYVNNASNLTIEDNYMPAPTATQGFRYEHINVGTVAGENSISYNYLDVATITSAAVNAGGIALSGMSGRTKIHGNKLLRLGRDNTNGHRLKALDCYFDCHNVDIRDNHILDCPSGFFRASYATNLIIKDNVFTAVTGNTLTEATMEISAGASNANENVLIQGNTFSHPDLTGVQALQVSSTNWEIINSGIVIHGNQFSGWLKSILLYGSIDGCYIWDNNWSDSGNGVSYEPAVAGTEASALIKDVIAQWNTADNTAAVHVAITTDATNDKFLATAHGLTNGTAVCLATPGNGVLPTEFNINSLYYVVSATANDFQLSATSGGAAITFVSDGTGSLAAYKTSTATKITLPFPNAAFTGKKLGAFKVDYNTVRGGNIGINVNNVNHSLVSNIVMSVIYGMYPRGSGKTYDYYGNDFRGVTTAVLEDGTTVVTVGIGDAVKKSKLDEAFKASVLRVASSFSTASLTLPSAIPDATPTGT